jgi:hypothetical protein
MPAPTSYNEDGLKAFMLGQVGNMGAVLGLDVNSFTEAVSDTLLAYGVPDVALALDIPKLRALARVEAWRVAVQQAAGRYDFQTQNAKHSRSALFAQAKEGLTLALADASGYASLTSNDNVIGISGFAYADNPYVDYEDSNAEFRRP